MSNEDKIVRTLYGRVISNKMDKTIVVLVERKIKHPLYGKYIIRSSKIHAHDEDNSCRVGDLVKVVATRPIARTKQWRLVAVMQPAVTE